MKQPKVLGTFSLAMISIIAVCNLRSLSFGALLGTSLVGYYLIAFCFFLLPVGLITASFSTHYPNSGGIYGWIKQAFGSRMGLVAVWLQWVYNVIWYPTQMIFVSSLINSLFFPSFYKNTLWIFMVSLGLFSLFTFINFFGIRFTSWALNICATLGTLMPLGLFSAMVLYKGLPLITSWHFGELLPSVTAEHLVYLSGVTFGLMGIEICGFHVESVDNPRIVYPRSLAIAGAVIILGMVLASLAIVMYVPQGSVDVLTAMVQTLDAFFVGDQFFLRETVGFLIMIGGSATVLTWIMGPSKGIVAAAKDGCAPIWLAMENKYGAPVAILWVQWVVFVFLSLGHSFIGIETLYLCLSVISTQLALVVYLLYFSAFWVMRKQLRQPGAFVVLPCLQTMMVIVGMIYCAFVMAVGFIAPEHTFGLTPTGYVASLMLGMLGCFGFLWMMSRYER